VGGHDNNEGRRSARHVAEKKKTRRGRHAIAKIVKKRLMMSGAKGREGCTKNGGRGVNYSEGRGEKVPCSETKQAA